MNGAMEFGCTSMTKPPHMHAVTVPPMKAVTVPPTMKRVYVSTPVQLATTRTKHPAQHANRVYQVLTMMKPEKRCAKTVLVDGIQLEWVKHLAKEDAVQEHFHLKWVKHHRQNANLVEQVIINHMQEKQLATTNA